MSAVPATPSSPPLLKRRIVRYRGYEMIVEDAERIAAGTWQTVGHWTFPQILDHLSKSFAASLDGIDTQLPWPVRIIGRLFLKGRFLNKTLPAGFQIPQAAAATFAPDDHAALEASLDRFRQVVARCKTEKQRARHPLFGRLDRPEWDRFNLRHAELHMSFVVPTGPEHESVDELPTPQPEAQNA